MRETSPARAAYTLYMEMGPTRSLAKVAQECTKSVSLIHRWSGAHGWQARIAAYEHSVSEACAAEARAADIARVMRDYTAEGTHGPYDIKLHAEQLAQAAFGKSSALAKDTMGQAIKQFEYDRQYGNASPATLTADIEAVRKAMQGISGTTPLDIRDEIARLTAELAKGGPRNATEPGAGHHYFGVNPRDLPGSGAGFGQALVAFGSGANAQAESNNLLRQQLAAALRREARDEHQIAVQEAQLAEDRRQITILEAQLAAETRTADGIRTMLAGDAGGVHRGFKRSGIAHPIAR